MKDPTKKINDELLKKDMAEIFYILSPRERDVLRLRFGIDDGRQRTLNEVGELFGITRERVRQIIDGAIDKLRNSNSNEHIKEYTN